MERQPSSSATFSPDSVATTTRTPETGSSGEKTSFSLQTPQNDSTNQPNQPIRIESKSFRMNWNSEARPFTTGISPGYERDIESRKRKSSFHHSRSIPTVNLELEFSMQSEAAGRDMHSDVNGDMLYDDQFYEGLDFDALEVQATFLLKQKSELPVQKAQVIPQLHPQNHGPDSAPSFDLGI